ncbi:fimbrial protein [Citrobacter farmeri]|uniref:Fimbrial protein n=1 Tax=Citrobacter amalonaticus Y19 TaxID=1261127 RepID=A0A0F6TXD1_CITAM|nr:fimbrial protein [Citrobacter amalonaticus]AKE60507.1 fimbrial protein [Citrobacter amalonaticus Y19]EKV5655413.1 type 1 fimbrial protein [Citrobacter farmeri]
MKKLTGIALSLGLALFTTHSALAADATVNFNGTILASTCRVASADSVVNVTMGNYGPSYFSAPGTTTLAVPFAISLTDCPTAAGSPTTALVTFVGTADTTNLAVTGGATGVAIQIKKADNTPIVVNTPDSGMALTTDASQNLNFTANYISTAASVTPGAANGQAQVNISYL